MKYCLDTSAIIDAAIRWYPPDLFPSFWDRLSELVTANELISHEQVLLVLEKKEGDVAHQWALDHRQIFLTPTDETEAMMGTVMGRFPEIAKGAKGQHFADPFVIATASVHSSTVVTGERETGNLSKPRIPDVCRELSISCLSIVDLIRAEGWQF